MKLTCLKKYLKEAVSLCERITGKNLSLPILSNILISGEGSVLKFTATNLELGIEVKVPAKVEQKGDIAIPAGIINNFLSNFSGEESITLESKNENLSVSTLSTSTLIKGQPIDDFPSLPKTSGVEPILLPVSELISGLKSVWYACSTSNIIKPEFSSVLLVSKKEKQLTFASTDSFRLAEKKLTRSFGDLGPLLIPFKTVSEILRVFDGKEGDIKIIPDENQLFLEWENIRFISRLTEGSFPDYEEITPKHFISDVVVDKVHFSNSLKTASIFSGKLSELNISLDQKNNVMVLKTSSTDTGEHLTKIPVKITGEDVRASFNYKYISDCLPHITSKEIIMRFSEGDNKMLITGTDDNTFRYLVMPLSNI